MILDSTTVTSSLSKRDYYFYLNEIGLVPKSTKHCWTLTLTGVLPFFISLQHEKKTGFLKETESRVKKIFCL